MKGPNDQDWVYFEEKLLTTNMEDLDGLSTDSLQVKTREFLGEKVKNLSQEEVDKELERFLIALSTREVDGFRLFAFALPHTETKENIDSGKTSAAKIYRALFNFQRSDFYKENPKVWRLVSDLENVIDQDSHMVGPVALWEMAKDFMWRKDIPVQAKDSLAGGITYALAFSNREKFKDEILKHLNFKNPDSYKEVSQILEALKWFWSSGHESYAEDNDVPSFYIDILKEIEESPESNYLLSMRAKELLSILEESYDFPNEKRDKTLFEITRDTYASHTSQRGLMLVSDEKVPIALESLRQYEDVQKKLLPPKHLIEDARARGLDHISWTLPRDISSRSSDLYEEMHSFATIPIENKIPEIKSLSKEEKEEFIFDYEYLVSRPMREMIQREFGFELKDLSIQEQFYFLNYLKKVTNAEVNNVKYFTQKYGAVGFRTFLSMNHERNIGDEIINIGNQLPEADARAIFEKYSEIVDVANEVENYIRENVQAESFDQKQIDAVRDNVLRRGTDLLLSFSKQVREVFEKGEMVDSEEIRNQLETFKRDSILFASTFRELNAGLSAAGRGEEIFDSMKNISFETLKGADFSEADKLAMRNIFDQNYSGSGLRVKVKESFEKRLNDPEVDFYVVRNEGRIISFLSLQPSRDEKKFHQKFAKEIGDNEIYFGSFNSFNGYKGGSVGDAMMRKVLDREAQEKIIHADCPAILPIGAKYIEDGFLAVATYELENVPSLEIVRDDSINFDSKTMTKDQIVQTYLRRELGMSDDYKNVEIFSVQNQKDLNFSLLKEGRVLTRYFKFANDAKWYAVFEKVAD